MQDKTVAWRFAGIWLRNWKNFATCDVPLAARVFLVGPNASGKSNFLDVFRFLRDLVALGGGLREAISHRGGVSALRCLAVRRYQDVAIRADVKGEKVWQYELAFNQDNQRRVQIKKEKVTCEATVFLDRPNLEDEQDPARLSQTYLEQVNVNKEFRVLGGCPKNSFPRLPAALAVGHWSA